jgi:RHH-type proline utilization regulon transcriptional repressor/proline dehydrogenase/delta 1-pyrroline-5-carboxylate dehydrogenase
LPQPAALEDVLATAVAEQPKWAALSWDQRAQLLRHCAATMEEQRFDTIALMVHDGKKASWEADAEISEAIDFANYYADFRLPTGVKAEALGVVVITPPWNFPYAIPCGGVLAALMAGNTVIFKPAPETAATAWRLAQQLWQAGIPRNVLQFFPIQDGETGKALITDPRVSAVVLTGAYETARMFQGWRPSLRLFAETSGKNSLIITAQADRDLAIKDLVKSAFGHAGQKCSAASLAILEGEVYDDPDFRRQLRDAAASLKVGPSTNPASIVTPVIREPSPALKRALTTLDEGEEWLLEPKQIDNDPCSWSPGIKLGVKEGSWFQQNECFGPVLGLVRVESLDEAIRVQNNSAYGLTGGIHSLDEAEVAHWRERVEVGNAYINRPITGAIVQRQPFGGWKRSCIGPGAKAGGPNYVNLFLNLEDTETANLATVTKNYEAAWKEHFSQEHDPSALRCEANVFRYRPAKGVILRLESEDQQVIERARAAARLAKVPLIISLATEVSDEAFAKELPKLAKRAEFVRTVTTPSDTVLRATYAANLNWINAPVMASGHVELRYWLREQAVSETLHRYGQISEWQPTK